MAFGDIKIVFVDTCCAELARWRTSSHLALRHLAWQDMAGNGTWSHRLGSVTLADNDLYPHDKHARVSGGAVGRVWRRGSQFVCDIGVNCVWYVWRLLVWHLVTSTSLLCGRVRFWLTSRCTLPGIPCQLVTSMHVLCGMHIQCGLCLVARLVGCI